MSTSAMIQLSVTSFMSPYHYRGRYNNSRFIPIPDIDTSNIDYGVIRPFSDASFYYAHHRFFYPSFVAPVVYSPHPAVP